MVRQGIANPLSPVQIWVPPNNLWGCGGMVDTTDLKSVDYYGREGSSPSTPIFFIFYLCYVFFIFRLDYSTKKTLHNFGC